MSFRNALYMKPKAILILLIALAALALTQCTGQQMQRQVRESRTVVLDIGHYYVAGRGGQGARTPDATKGGAIEECEFWYRNARYVKQEIEKAGYTCIVCNRGATPDNPPLAKCAKEIGVVQLNTPVPTGVYRSKHHPWRLAVGMLSADYALDQKPAAVIFLHLNSDSDTWSISNKVAFYCNETGIGMSKTMANVMNRDIIDHGMPNHGIPCGVIVRNDGRKGGGDWLNTCNESYVPAAITEVAFLSNPEHARYLATPANAADFARAIGRGIVSYLQNR